MSALSIGALYGGVTLLVLFAGVPSANAMGTPANSTSSVTPP